MQTRLLSLSFVVITAMAVSVSAKGSRESSATTRPPILAVPYRWAHLAIPKNTKTFVYGEGDAWLKSIGMTSTEVLQIKDVRLTKELVASLRGNKTFPLDGLLPRDDISICFFPIGPRHRCTAHEMTGGIGYLRGPKVSFVMGGGHGRYSLTLLRHESRLNFEAILKKIVGLQREHSWRVTLAPPLPWPR